MTRRAFRPSVSAGACVAPVISKEAGVPWGAFGSIAVLISCFAFPALVGGARRREKTVPKRVRRSDARRLEYIFRYCGWLPALEGEKIPGPRRLPASPAARLVPFPSGAQYTFLVGGCQ